MNALHRYTVPFRGSVEVWAHDSGEASDLAAFSPVPPDDITWGDPIKGESAKEHQEGNEQ